MSKCFNGFGKFDCYTKIWQGIFHASEDSGSQILRDMLSISEYMEPEVFSDKLRGIRSWSHDAVKFWGYSKSESAYKAKWFDKWSNHADCFDVFQSFIDSVPQESTNLQENRLLSVAHEVSAYLEQVLKHCPTDSYDRKRWTAAGMYALATFFTQNGRNAKQGVKITPQLYCPPKAYNPVVMPDCAVEENKKNTVIVPQVTMHLPDFRLPAIPLQSDNYIEDSRKDEVAAISRALTEDDKAVFISGVGGIGKSSVAIDVANKSKEHFEDSYWITYQPSSEEDLENMENTILKVAFTDYTFQPDSQHLKALPEEKLHRKLIEMELAERFQLLGQSYQNSLIVIDNFDDPTKTINELQKEHSYSTLLNLGIKLLFTTRSPIGYEIKALDTPHLLQLMRKYCTESVANDEQIEEFIRITDGHTLTCELIAKTLSESWGDVTADDVLQALRNSTLSEEDYPEVQNDKGRFTDGEIRTAQIYEHLKALFDISSLDHCHQNVMRYAALLPADGMDAKLFIDCLEKEERKTAKNLEKRGWLKHSQKDKLLRIHPMIREVVFEELVKGREDACKPFLEKLFQQYNDSEYNAIKYRQMAECFAFVADKVLIANDVCSYWAGFLFNHLGEYVKAKRYLENAKGIKTKNPMVEKTVAKEIYLNLGVVCIRLGDYNNALIYMNEAQKIQEEVEPDAPEVAITYSYLGLIHSKLEQDSQAIFYLDKAIKIQDATLPNDYLDRSLTYFILGNLYKESEVTGTALYYLDEARKIQEHGLPHNHLDLALTYRCLGEVYRDSEDEAQAFFYLNKAKEIQEQKLPSNHCELSNTYIILGILYDKVGDHIKALHYLEKAKEIVEQLESGDESILAGLYGILGTIYYAVGDCDTAITYMEKSIENPNIPRYELYKQ